MTPKAQRSWYRMHWLTLCLMAWLFWAIRDCQLQKQAGYLYGKFEMGSPVFVFGWPFRDLRVTDNAAYPRRFLGLSARPIINERRWNVLALGTNCFVWLALVGSTAWVIERWLRGPNRFQFGLQSLLALTGVAAVLVAILSQSTPYWIFRLGVEPSFEVEWCNIRKPLRLILPLSIGCTTYFLGWIVCTIAVSGWAWTFQSRTNIRLP